MPRDRPSDARGEQVTRYWEGVNEAVARLDEMDEAALLAVIDTLYGRDDLKYGDGHAELLNEARRQVRRDFERPVDDNARW